MSVKLRRVASQITIIQFSFVEANELQVSSVAANQCRISKLPSETVPLPSHPSVRVPRACPSLPKSDYHSQFDHRRVCCSYSLVVRSICNVTAIGNCAPLIRPSVRPSAPPLFVLRLSLIIIIHTSTIGASALSVLLCDIYTYWTHLNQ